jgi:hypothetical protein
MTLVVIANRATIEIGISNSMNVLNAVGLRMEQTKEQTSNVLFGTCGFLAPPSRNNAAVACPAIAPLENIGFGTC